MGKKPTPKSKVPAAVAARRRKAFNPVLYGMIFIAMVVISFPTVLIVGFGLLPTIVAFIVDRTKKRYASVCVGGMNLAGVFPHLLPIWYGAHTADQAIETLTDVFVLFVMYGAAMFGWVLYFTIPPAVGAVLAVMAQSKVAELRTSQKRLIEEWGESVANPLETVETPAAEPEPS